MMDATDPPDRELWERVERAIRQETGPAAAARGMSTRARVAVAAVAALAIPAVVLLAWARVDLAVYPHGRLAGEVLLLVALGAAAVVVAMRPLHRPPLPYGTGIALVAATLLAALILAVLPAAHRAHAASLAGGGADLLRRAVGCLVLGLVFAAPVLLMCRLLERMGKVVPAAVAAAALAGIAGLQLHCPIVHGVHLAAGHATVVVALAVATAPWLRRA